ncbi:hypothetical protein DMENIID0001_070600 [Sergentomyia squamirostris]
MEMEGDESGEMENLLSDDNLGSCGSVDDVKTPDDDTESLSMSSPGCLSALSSLQSPSASITSPITLIASPCPDVVGGGRVMAAASRNGASPRSQEEPPINNVAVRSPIGANPRDINNPLSVNQLTKRDYAGSTSSSKYDYAQYHTYSGAAIAAPQFSSILTAAAAAAAASTTETRHRDTNDDGAISVT